MYELLVLSLLMKFPLHAYLISKIANDTIGPWEKISRGTLSTLLNKLNKASLIQDAEPKHVPFPTGRPSRTYEITAKGRDRFYELMMETDKNLGNYTKIFHIKAICLEFLSYEDQLYVANHYIKYCQRAIDHIKEQQLEFDNSPEEVELMQDTPYYEKIRGLMAMKVNQWELERQWAADLMENKKKGE
ncbi:DNA-binding PadR family transcriptional regulator [Scopulibacillus darangshiensis]|uniref:DNA-binding PadR family transcriptional regulator n=1 Tax=Scopulibacillus darangshiensis TaxID=442528 RepID=A0A4R2P2B7_9BACL|nr:PadR family transcriptional regulator [Scopulibacillus darangshiensis]TCP28869.1 DNA-binding PadR family transcriptional regulator [Scopulibacillus darangshiensis]